MKTSGWARYAIAMVVGMGMIHLEPAHAIPLANSDSCCIASQADKLMQETHYPRHYYGYPRYRYRNYDSYYGDYYYRRPYYRNYYSDYGDYYYRPYRRHYRYYENYYRYPYYGHRHHYDHRRW
jgi:hypothetical protein